MIKYTNNTSMIVKSNLFAWLDRKKQYDQGHRPGLKYNSTEEFDNSTRFKLNQAKRFLRSIGR